MLRVDLRLLERKGSVQVEGSLEPNQHSFEGCGFILEKPLRVALNAAWAGSGEVVLRGTLEGSVTQECRRCLAVVERAVDRDVTMVFVDSELFKDDNEETRHLERGVREINLEPHVRDELIFAVPMYIECRADCQGFCAECGQKLNDADCECSTQEADPRWDALRALKNE